MEAIGVSGAALLKQKSTMHFVVEFFLTTNLLNNCEMLLLKDQTKKKKKKQKKRVISKKLKHNSLCFPEKATRKKFGKLVWKHF